MNNEIETKFLAINHEMIRKKLRDCGANCVQPMRLMRRLLFDYPDSALRQKSALLRLRDEGQQVTLSYKELGRNGRDSLRRTRELEVIVSSFKATKDLLESMGLKICAYRETKRENWHLGLCEVMLDEWPFLEPMIEIEGPSVEAVQAVAARLDLPWKMRFSKDIAYVYGEKYLVGRNRSFELPHLEFGVVPKEILR